MALASNNNYFFYSGDYALPNILVEIVISEDLTVWSSYQKGTPQNTQFSFQLNAWSSATGNAAWQQYVFLIAEQNGVPTLSTRIEYWPSAAYAASGTTGISPTGEFLHASGTAYKVGPNGQKQSFQMPSTPLSGLTLSKGTRLSITLANNPAGDVTAVTFSATDPNNHAMLQNDSTIEIAGLYTSANAKSVPPTLSVPLPPDALSPIYAFQLNLVGADTGHALLWTGAGTITYGATVPLAVATEQPTWTGAQGTVTYETANSVYGDVTGLGDDWNGNVPGYFGFSQPFATFGYAPGGFLAASPQFGDNQRTNLFGIGSTGQLTLFDAEGSGNWKQHAPIGPDTFPPFASPFAPPGAALAVSNQFGIANRTDIFVVGNDEQLNVFWCDNGVAGWNGPQAISQPPFAAPAGTSVAAARIFDAASNQTGVFLVDHKGTLTVFSVANGGNWNSPAAISDQQFTSPGATVAAYDDVLGQTGVFVIDRNGAMNVILTTASGTWAPPKIISGPGFVAAANASIAVSQRFGVTNQVDVYAVDQAGLLHVFSLVRLQGHGAIPSTEVWLTGTIGPGPDPDSGAPFALPGSPVAVSQQFGVLNQTDVFVVDSIGNLNVFWAIGDGGWNGPLRIGAVGDGIYNAPMGSFVAASNQFGVNNQTDVFLMNAAPGGPGTFPGLGWPVVFWVEKSAGWSGPAALILEV